MVLLLAVGEQGPVAHHGLCGPVHGGGRQDRLDPLLLPLGLLDEVATGKVTGEEEYWSRTDLHDFQANVDGARVAYEGLQPLLDVKDPALSQKIQAAFRDLQSSLDQYREGKDDFVSYDTVTEPQRKELSDKVNALAEPLSKLTGAITL